MKKLHFFLLGFFISSLVLAQDVDDKKINFEYIQLPLTPVNISLKNYQSNVVLEYEPAVKAQKEEYTNKVKQAEDKYAADMAAYEVKVKEAEDKYQKELDEYNKKSTGQKFVNQQLLKEGKPVKQLPSTPYKSLPAEPTYLKLFDPSLLASTYLKLEGFNKSATNAVTVTGLLKGFQHTEPELKVNEVTVVKNNVTYKEKEYTYEFHYKHPMGLKIEVPGTGVVFNEYLDNLNEYKTYTTNKYKSEYELQNSFNKTTVISSLEDKITAENLKRVNEFLNNNFGYPKVKKEIEISIVEGKNYQYNDYQQAFEGAVIGFNQLAADPDKSVSSQNLKSSIGLWETALKESDLKNKKARINGNVTMATYFNLATVAIYADDFATSEMYINKILISDPSKKERRNAEELRTVQNDFKTRFEARQKLK